GAARAPRRTSQPRAAGPGARPAAPATSVMPGCWYARAPARRPPHRWRPDWRRPASREPDSWRTPSNPFGGAPPLGTISFAPANRQDAAPSPNPSHAKLGAPRLRRLPESLRWERGISASTRSVTRDILG